MARSFYPLSINTASRAGTSGLPAVRSKRQNYGLDLVGPLMDTLSAPQHEIGSLLAGDGFVNPYSAAADRYDPSQLLKPGPGRVGGLLGLGADVLLDPLNAAAGAGLLKGAATGAGKVAASGVGKAARDEVLKSAAAQEARKSLNLPEITPPPRIVSDAEIKAMGLPTLPPPPTSSLGIVRQQTGPSFNEWWWNGPRDKAMAQSREKFIDKTSVKRNQSPAEHSRLEDRAYAETHGQHRMAEDLLGMDAGNQQVPYETARGFVRSQEGSRSVLYGRRTAKSGPGAPKNEVAALESAAPTPFSPSEVSAAAFRDWHRATPSAPRLADIYRSSKRFSPQIAGDNAFALEMPFDSAVPYAATQAFKRQAQGPGSLLYGRKSIVGGGDAPPNDVAALKSKRPVTAPSEANPTWNFFEMQHQMDGTLGPGINFPSDSVLRALESQARRAAARAKRQALGPGSLLFGPRTIK